MNTRRLRVPSSSAAARAAGAGLRVGATAIALAAAAAAAPQADGPALGAARTTQAAIESGSMTLDEIRAAGLKIFSTPFNRHDGYGDGPMDPANPVDPGGRPTLQGNGTFLRVNGLDAQTCMECHAVGSFATVPFTFAVGGVGASNSNVLFKPRNIDVDDEASAGIAGFDGRYINPPFLFGSGGIELLANEMTADLQLMRRLAFNSPGTVIELETHGVSFGQLRYDAQTASFDTSAVEGIEHDLVVRPFGRKGEFATVRGFDLDAMNFHFGMQPAELVGAGVDGDQDGVVDEVLAGEISALHIFNTNLERPRVRGWNMMARAGFDLFSSIGCAECHIPRLETRSSELVYRFPEVENQPQLNEFMRVDLADSPAGFSRTPAGGLRVPLFSDLKRHDMGPGLAESFGSELDSQFITARLWGVADTAPYLHDGRATTLTDAIVAHGGEAEAAKEAFVALSEAERVQVITFLKRLRTPENPAADIQ